MKKIGFTLTLLFTLNVSARAETCLDLYREKNATHFRVVKLIEQAQEFSQSGGTTKAGGQLRRLFNQVTNDEYTILDLANEITRTSENKDLCYGGNLRSYFDIKFGLILNGIN